MPLAENLHHAQLDGRPADYNHAILFMMVPLWRRVQCKLGKLANQKASFWTQSPSMYVHMYVLLSGKEGLINAPNRHVRYRTAPTRTVSGRCFTVVQ